MGKYYTQEQLDAIFNFKHKSTAKQTDETMYKMIDGESFWYTNFDEFQKIGGTKSFMFLVNEEDREVVKLYWDLLNKTDGNAFIAGEELSKICNSPKCDIILQTYMNKIHKAFTRYATNGEHDDISIYMKNNMDMHNKIVKHYLKTGEILDLESLMNEYVQQTIGSTGNIGNSQIKTTDEFNKVIINNKAKHGALTSQEAFDMYGPNDDRFFTSQGLDPIEQRKILNELNDVEAYNAKNAVSFLQNDTDTVTEAIDDEITQIESDITDNNKNQLNNQEPDVKNTSSAIKINKSVEQTAKETVEETIEQAIKPTEHKAKRKLKLKKISDTTSVEQAIKPTEQAFKETIEKTAQEMTENATKQVVKSLPTKTLGNGGKLAIGLAIAGALICIATNNNKRTNKRISKQTNKQEKTVEPHSLSMSTNSEEYNNQYAQQMAADISSYKYGKHMTGFVNF